MVIACDSRKWTVHWCSIYLRLSTLAIVLSQHIEYILQFLWEDVMPLYLLDNELVPVFDLLVAGTDNEVFITT